MHRGQDHDHHLDLRGANFAEGEPVVTGAGHNNPPADRPLAQWQTPHLTDQPPKHEHREPDIDLVEAAFADGFSVASDPTSFLRLARVPFETTTADGTKLALLRVEIDAVTDVGSVMPHLGGASFRYDPLPGPMAAQRRRLRFVYFDGQGLRPLSLSEVRDLPEGTA